LDLYCYASRAAQCLPTLGLKTYVPGASQTEEAPLDSGKPFKNVPRKYLMDTTRRSILLAAVPLLVGSVPLKAAIEEGFMTQSDQDFGSLNVKAPAELTPRRPSRKKCHVLAVDLCCANQFLTVRPFVHATASHVALLV
jgi:hypothetical protein